MKAIFNHQVVDSDKISIEYSDRAFQYGDGLFETLMVREGEIQFPELHFNRLIMGSEILSLNHSLKEYALFENEIQNLLNQNPEVVNGRIRLQLWRKSGGLYTPLNTEANFLLSIKEWKTKVSSRENLGVSNSIRLSHTQFSQLKTLNCIPFILASIEAKNSIYDDLILLGRNEVIAECCSSNIFWIKENQIFTPSLESGCVAGIMRQYCLQVFNSNSIESHQVLSPFDEILKADSVFKTNVTGIYQIASIDGHAFENDIELPFKLRKFLS